MTGNSKNSTSDGLHAERQGRSQRLPLRFKHWDPAFLAYCKQLEEPSRSFLRDLNVAHTELDLATPNRIAARRASRTRTQGFRIS